MSSLANLLRKNIKSLMEKTGWNQSELARRLNWEPSHLSNYLKDREPGLDKISELAEVFGVSPAEILNEHTEPKPNIIVERHELADEIKDLIELQFEALKEELRDLQKPKDEAPEIVRSKPRITGVPANLNLDHIPFRVLWKLKEVEPDALSFKMIEETINGCLSFEKIDKLEEEIKQRTNGTKKGSKDFA